MFEGEPVSASPLFGTGSSKGKGLGWYLWLKLAPRCSLTPPWAVDSVGDGKG